MCFRLDSLCPEALGSWSSGGVSHVIGGTVGCGVQCVTPSWCTRPAEGRAPVDRRARPLMESGLRTRVSVRPDAGIGVSRHTLLRSWPEGSTQLSWVLMADVFLSGDVKCVCETAVGSPWSRGSLPRGSAGPRVPGRLGTGLWPWHPVPLSLQASECDSSEARPPLWEERCREGHRFK